MDPLSLSPADEGGASQDILQRSAKRKFAVIPTTNEVTKLMDVGTLATGQQVTVFGEDYNSWVCSGSKE